MAQTASYDQDPDFVRWGLQLFESDPYSNSYAFTHSNPLDGVGFYNDSDECCNADDDEFIARALQQELSNLAVSEPAESQHDDDADDGDGIDDNLQVAVLEQDWIAQSSMASYSSGQEDGQEEGDTDEMGVSSSCSSPQEEDSSYREEDWSSYSLEMMDEYAFGGEVGKWLDEMVPIPHVPRINGEIPSIDEATIDHQRLLDRLQVYDLVERKVQGDGNCQFRALSDQFYRTPEHHEFVRQQVVNQLKSYPGKYEGYVPMAYADYLEKMSKSGEWGDHVTLQAAADSYGVKIIVITSFKDTCYIEIIPSVQRSIRVILLSFWAEVHYNSIFPRGDVPAFQSKKKKKWRMFRNKHLESVDE